MPIRARIVAGHWSQDVADVLASMAVVDRAVMDKMRVAMHRFGDAVVALVDGLDDPAATHRTLTDAGVESFRVGRSLMLVYRMPPFGEPPWRTFAPEVYQAVSAALQNHRGAPGNVVWDDKVLPLSQRAHVMGIVNVTPDSFSDGGLFLDPETAIKHGLHLAEEGADILDVGGESTRPGADPVDADTETRRVVPVIEGLARQTPTPISVDTTKAEVARAALDAGASIINDVSAGRFDPPILDLAAERGVPVVLMHMLGDPRTMQQDPTYDDVVGEIATFLADRADAAVAAGVSRARILIDPGFGFGKTREHNLILLRRLRELTSLGTPVVAGTSRKSFIGLTLDVPVEERLEGTAATVAVAVMNGAAVVRVHDAGPMRRVASMVDAVTRASHGAQEREP